ncbi:hypothetical protein [Sphingomonas sp.]|jgi:hypothetical protein|uniref:hypothetical protein n=1 Tax=Sphingomonas sp. TaxID=28214 RepID=UPI002D8007EA|nr:hypothetical protein [Sphingomonas sp.]HEU0043553.1 hypothetical protein [Sphingomonas sp.]
MHWGGPEFVLWIVALAIGAGIIKTWIRAKHGYPLEDRGRKHERRMRRAQELDGLDDTRKVALLTTENERLNGQVGRLEERLAVLERIVTDPAERTAREIDALR